jgi:hypothetical protein
MIFSTSSYLSSSLSFLGIFFTCADIWSWFRDPQSGLLLLSKYYKILQTITLLDMTEQTKLYVAMTY